MRLFRGLLPVGLLCAAASLGSLHAQDTSQNIVGYYNFRFYTGDNLFQNGLLASNNKLSSLFGTGTPENTVISLWDPITRTFNTSSSYVGGIWSADLTLTPGTGARLTTGIGFTNTFVGEVVSRNGLPFTEPIALPPVYAGPNGIFLWGDRVPMSASGNDVFLNVVGRLPNIGEQYTRLDGATQTYITSTYGMGGWDIIPQAIVGGAGFFNIGPVPEPSSGMLALMGAGLALKFARRKNS